MSDALVVGIGCTRGTPAALIEQALDQLLAAHGLAWSAVRALATLDRKHDEPGLRAFATAHDLSLTLYTVQQLAAAASDAGSERVRTHVGTPAVAEPAARLRAGTDALLVPKTVHGEDGGPRVTLAIARLCEGRDG